MLGPANRIIASTGGGHRHKGGFDDGIAIDYVDSVVLDAVVAPLATCRVGIAPFSTMTRLGHDFLIGKHTFTEAPASAADAVWFADRNNPPAFDPNRLWKGSAMRYVLKLAFEFLVLMLKITGYSFGLLLLVLGELSANSRPSKTKYWCGESDDGYDQFGSPMTPGEEGMGLVSRKHYL